MVLIDVGVTCVVWFGVLTSQCRFNKELIKQAITSYSLRRKMFFCLVSRNESIDLFIGIAQKNDFHDINTHSNSIIIQNISVLAPFMFLDEADFVVVILFGSFGLYVYLNLSVLIIKAYLIIITLIFNIISSLRLYFTTQKLIQIIPIHFTSLDSQTLQLLWCHSSLNSSMVLIDVGVTCVVWREF